MKYRLAYIILNSILLALFSLTALIYALSSAYPSLFALLVFSFNPTLLIMGVGLIILGNFDHVSIINKLLPFIGLIGINIPGVVGRMIFPDIDADTALIYTGVASGLSLCLVTAIVMYSGLKVK